MNERARNRISRILLAAAVAGVLGCASAPADVDPQAFSGQEEVSRMPTYYAECRDPSHGYTPWRSPETSSRMEAQSWVKDHREATGHRVSLRRSRD